MTTLCIIAIFAAMWVVCPKEPVWKTAWWKRHVCDTCNYPAECFDCRKGTCEGCPVLNHGK